jgi:hypothetical protein
MRRISWILAAVLCSAMFLFAGDNDKASEMTGWVCNSKCVTQNMGKATCNASCSETSGNVVFIDDQGQVSQIANQEMAKPMTGKRCKMKATMDPSTGMLAVQNIVEYEGP